MSGAERTRAEHRGRIGLPLLSAGESINVMLSPALRDLVRSRKLKPSAACFVTEKLEPTRDEWLRFGAAACFSCVVHLEQLGTAKGQRAHEVIR